MAVQLQDKIYLERLGIPGNESIQAVFDLFASKLYNIFPIWAEEQGALQTGEQEWSFGDGDNGAINIAMPACEAFALSLDADVSGTSLDIELVKNDVIVNIASFVGANGYTTFTTPTAFNEGDLFGLRTGTEVGNYRSARACVWFRIPVVAL